MVRFLIIKLALILSITSLYSSEFFVLSKGQYKLNIKNSRSIYSPYNKNVYQQMINVAVFRAINNFKNPKIPKLKRENIRDIDIDLYSKKVYSKEKTFEIIDEPLFLRVDKNIWKCEIKLKYNISVKYTKNDYFKSPIEFKLIVKKEEIQPISPITYVRLKDSSDLNVLNIKSLSKKLKIKDTLIEKKKISSFANYIIIDPVKNIEWSFGFTIGYFIENYSKSFNNLFRSADSTLLLNVEAKNNYYIGVIVPVRKRFYFSISLMVNQITKIKSENTTFRKNFFREKINTNLTLSDNENIIYNFDNSRVNNTMLGLNFLLGKSNRLINPEFGGGVVFGKLNIYTNNYFKNRREFLKMNNQKLNFIAGLTFGKSNIRIGLSGLYSVVFSTLSMYENNGELKRKNSSLSTNRGIVVSIKVLFRKN